jgi:hypothetical protein
MMLTADVTRIRAEVKELQKASAVLACIQRAAEYANECDADLADAVAVVHALVSAVCARIDAALLRDSKAETEGEGPKRRRSMKGGADAGGGTAATTFPKTQPQKKERGPPEGLAPFSAVRSPAG